MPSLAGRLYGLLKRVVVTLPWPLRLSRRGEPHGRFLDAVQRATTATAPADRIDAAQQALADEACLDAWPLDIPRAQLRATMRVLLANAYDDLAADGSPEHLDLGIETYEQALDDIDPATMPTFWAETQNNLGYAYWRRPSGDRSADIGRAVAAYLKALRVYDRESHPEEWATLQNNLANAYVDWPLGDRRENIEKATTGYEAALTIHTRDAYPADWSMIQNNLGSAYHERIAGERRDNIERAIAAYEEALKERSPTGTPYEWAVTQGNLGNAYQDRIEGRRADNIDRAIAYDEAALTLLSREDFPLEWASAQNNLGVAYAARIHGEWEENIERAIMAYEAALAVTTRDAAPGAWAETQNNLGIALASRIRGDRDENLECAIAAFNAALTVHTPDDHPRDWALAQSNLGLAYQDRRSGKREENLEHARAAYMAALTVYSRDGFPREWARTQSNLALVHIHRVAGDRDQNLAHAVEILEAVLRVRTLVAEPHRRAAAQTVLGLSHLALADRSHPGSLTAAISCFEAALAVRTRDAHPRDHLLTARLLGGALLQNGNVPAARQAFGDARQAFMQLFAEGLNDLEARELLVEAGPLYMEGAFACASEGDLRAALAWADAGKARLLAVALRLRTLEHHTDDPTRVQTLRWEIRACSRALDDGDVSDRVATLDRLVALRRELRGIVAATDTARSHDTVSQEVLETILPQGGAVVVPIVTKFGSKVLLLVNPPRRSRDGVPGAVTALDVPELTAAHLNAFLKGPADDPALGGWLAAYARNYELARLGAEIAALPVLSAERVALEQQYLRLDDDWRAAIAALGPTLWQLLVGKLWAALQELGVLAGQRLLWIPPGSTGVLPLALAENPTTKRPLAEDYEIAYAPSLDALAHAADQARAAGAPTLAAIVNPTGDLDYAELEAEMVAPHFGAAVRLGSDAATPERVLEGLRHSTYWHFATHGRFDWRDPRHSDLRLAAGTTITVADLAEAAGLRPPRLVVLSACESGLYDTRRSPDEFIGWPATFMSLGAAGVLSTLWLVDDRATTLLVAKFYDLHMAQGLAPASALRRAQMWLKGAHADELQEFARRKIQAGSIAADRLLRLEALLKSGQIRSRLRGFFGWVPGWLADAGSATPRASAASPPPFAHPYFWGAFVHTGL